jgi:hypothetical protein
MTDDDYNDGNRDNNGGCAIHDNTGGRTGTTTGGVASTTISALSSCNMDCMGVFRLAPEGF